MTLPNLPILTGDTKKDVQLIFFWLNNFATDFPNIVGAAIDPTQGEGGSGSLTIDDVPTDISYSTGASQSIDETLFAHIDITCTKPDRAVGIVVRFREQGNENFKYTYTPELPVRLVSLKVGTIYDIQVAGQAANGSVGPFSDLQQVEINTDDFVLATIRGFIGIKVISDTEITTLTDILSFPVVAGGYYHIKFLMVTQGDVTFSFSNPTSDTFIYKEL
jgi:hypothetical protein